MENTCNCPKCQMDNAYHDGTCFVCPDCDFEWSSKGDIISDNYSENHSGFNQLSKLKVPFFRLEHGKLYDCKVEHVKGIEIMSIIPLTFKEGENVQFVMTDARTLLTQNAEFVREIIDMDYDYICNDGIRDDYPFDYEALTINCATQSDGTLIDYDGCVFFDFKLTDEI